MAGLDANGFIPLTYGEVKTNIETRLEAFNPGFDFSPESPDGQLIGIMSLLITEAWVELGLVYDSYNPLKASGQALRNIGLISGLQQGNATYGTAIVDLDGVAGTRIPVGSTVEDSDGNTFTTDFAGILPVSMPVTSTLAGPLPLPIGTINTVGTVITGWTTADQPAEGISGRSAVSEANYRNTRNRTVLRNYVGIVDTMESRLLELGMEQATVTNNSSTTVTLPDGTPPLTVHATVGEVGLATDTEIAQVILDTISVGTPTFGSTTVTLPDSQGVSHDINFTKASSVDVFIDLNITFLDDDIGGAVEDIRSDLITHINSLLAGEDVIWSRLFAIITPYAKAQVDSLLIGKSLGSLAASNIVMNFDEYALTSSGNIAITVT